MTLLFKDIASRRVPIAFKLETCRMRMPIKAAAEVVPFHYIRNLGRLLWLP